MSLAPLLYRIRKRLSLDHSLAQAACETVVFAKAETAVRSVAACLPGQLDRVKAVQPATSYEQEIGRITASSVRHSATTAYRFKDCVLVGGGLYAGKVRHQMLRDRPPLAASIDHDIDRAAFIGTPVSDIYFGHYLVDDSATALLARDIAPVYRPFSRHHANWNHPVDYQRMMGIDLQVTGNARVRDAWVFHDVGMTENRRIRLQTLRESLRTQPKARSGHGVYLVRGRSGQQLRLLRNEDAIANALASRGFEIVDPAQETAQDIVRKLSGASVAIGVEGSSLGHAFLTLADKGALLAIQPPHGFNNVWKDFTDLLDMRYGFVVAEGDGGGFDMNLDDILRTIDLMV